MMIGIIRMAIMTFWDDSDFGSIPKTGMTGRAVDPLSHKVNTPTLPITIPEPSSHDNAQTIRLGSQPRLTTVVITADAGPMET